jgi:hypothetical protein
VSEFYQATALEVAANWVHGILPVGAHVASALSPLEALALLLRPVLADPPCFVAFSGGRDSSAVLAVATAVAKSDGFELPIPVTERYLEVEEADESQWQEQVIKHLGVHEWIRLEFRDENDLVGSTAGEGLLRRGLVWPPAVQIKSNVLRGLGSGTLLTGEGGDEILGPRRTAWWPHLSRRTAVSRKVAARGAFNSLMPRAIRARQTVRSYRKAQWQPWLKPTVLERHLRLVAADEASEPLRWDRSLFWVPRRRSGVLARRNYQLLGAEHGVTVLDPLLDPRFLAALGAVSRFGFASRTEAMRSLFGDLLPPAVIERPGKAAFNRALMGRPTREFARRWDGSGLDASMVDADRLRHEWLAERPSALSSMLLQAAWLGTQVSSVSA